MWCSGMCRVGKGKGGGGGQVGVWGVGFGLWFIVLCGFLKNYLFYYPLPLILCNILFCEIDFTRISK